MAIKLRVISDQHRELGELRTRVFGVNGGSIGRAPDNDWILPDTKRIVSGHHCEIEYRNGTYWIKDISTNWRVRHDAEEPASQNGPVGAGGRGSSAARDYGSWSVDRRTDFAEPRRGKRRGEERGFGYRREARSQQPAPVTGGH
jgi:pSer/pThr/pTyr-binding forkhead associated (FHA) protein